jgi:hypothetical protein
VADHFVVYFVSRSGRFSRFAKVRRPATAHASSNSYAQADKYEQHQSEQR